MYTMKNTNLTNGIKDGTPVSILQTEYQKTNTWNKQRKYMRLALISVKRYMQPNTLLFK